MSEDTKPLYFTFATAGHVDHGKTSVLRALTGIDPDRLKEEKQRQMTTDIGFAHLNYPVEKDGKQLVIGFIDVPGHGKFLKNMLAGVGGIQMALLVVAADEGPMPQTVSHVKILSLLGVRKALVVLTKIDVADDARQKEVENLVKELLRRYQVECMGIAHVSNTENIGFESLKKELSFVVQSLDRPATSGGALLPIDRVFSKTGYGVVITGTLVSGQLAVGETVSIEPGGIKGRVRGLETFKKQLQGADSGQRLAVNISLKENKTLARGQVVANWNPPVVNTLIARIEQVGLADEWIKPSDIEDQPVRLYHGTAECFGHLRWCQMIETGQALIVQIVLTDPVVAEPGDRFVVRYGDEGITGGVVLVTNRPRWMTRNRLNVFADQLVRHDYKAATDYFLENMTQPAAKKDALASFLPIADRGQVLESCVKAGSVVQHAGFIIGAKRAQSIKQQIVKAVSAGDASEHGPTEYSIELIRTKVAKTMDRQLFQHLLKELSDANSVTRSGDKVSLKSDKAPTVSHAQTVLADQVLNILSTNLCIEIDEISKLLKSDRKLIMSTLQNLTKQEKAFIVDHDYSSSAESIRKAHVALAKIWESKKEISPSEFRESLSTSRKYAMALLAYFDNKLITRRVNNTRMLIKAP
ncbi:MAG: selenocysteine-specific translation elongation factor [Cyanobacteria bacterium SZAS-4]|nr:selenocysteine-specific translation elongation factor [Cyanobacteria bacterium SZAS-4]